jgi:hypothetical protein
VPLVAVEAQPALQGLPACRVIQVQAAYRVIPAPPANKAFRVMTVAQALPVSRDQLAHLAMTEIQEPRGPQAVGAEQQAPQVLQGPPVLPAAEVVPPVPPVHRGTRACPEWPVRQVP